MKCLSLTITKNKFFYFIISHLLSFFHIFFLLFSLFKSLYPPLFVPQFICFMFTDFSNGLFIYISLFLYFVDLSFSNFPFKMYFFSSRSFLSLFILLDKGLASSLLPFNVFIIVLTHRAV